MLEADKLKVQVVVDNTTDMLSSRPAHVTSELRVLMAAGMKELAGESLCSAHHGLCLAVTAHFAKEERTVLFDAGPDPYALVRNGGHLKLDFEKIDALVLSHGHFDHSEGLLTAAKLIRSGNKGRRIPLHVHPGAFVKRALRLSDGTLLPLQDVPSRQALQRAGIDLVESDQPEEIIGGSFLLTGEIPRRSFERGLANQVRLNEAGGWEPDPLCIDERFMVANVKGKGLALFTGCSHAGVINICNHAGELFPDIPLYALVGGLHLVHPNEDLIGETIEELKKFGFKVIIAGHCTGWRAINSLLNAFGEEVVDPLAVGSKLSL
jgi:7,8-dihydropterin-6-yl-methyl-4-(beta-D-ribofuranosyl)aminobenzene 5'-phosphate synthase